MQFRVVRLRSRNPLVGVALLVVVLAILAFVLTAGLALLAGGAVIGGAALLARRVFGGRGLEAGRPDERRALVQGEEVFPPGEAAATERRLPPIERE